MCVRVLKSSIFMKNKIYRGLASLFLASFALSGSAVNLVVEESSGGVSRFDLGSNPILTCRGDSLVVSSNEASASFLIDDVAKYYFRESESTEVTDKLASVQFVAVKDGDVLIKNGKAGSVVDVYSADGLSVGRYAVSADGSLKISLTNLPKGVYLIKTNLATIKVIR